MSEINLPKLLPSEIKEFFKTHIWKLENIILFSLGYDFTQFKGSWLGNSYPERLYANAVYAIRKGDLICHDQILSDSQPTQYRVNKTTFFYWAFAKWGAEIEVSQTYLLWAAHRIANGKNVPETNDPVIKCLKLAQESLIELLEKHHTQNPTNVKFKFKKKTVDALVHKKMPSRGETTIARDYNKSFLNKIVQGYCKKWGSGNTPPK